MFSAAVSLICLLFLSDTAVQNFPDLLISLPFCQRTHGDGVDDVRPVRAFIETQPAVGPHADSDRGPLGRLFAVAHPSLSADLHGGPLSGVADR